MSPNPEGGATAPGDTEPVSFEVAYRELQQVVGELEEGRLDLERAMQLFERGTYLVHACERIVDAAELRVTRLTAEPASPLSDASFEP